VVYFILFWFIERKHISWRVFLFVYLFLFLFTLGAAVVLEVGATVVGAAVVLLVGATVTLEVGERVGDAVALVGAVGAGGVHTLWGTTIWTAYSHLGFSVKLRILATV